MRRSIRSLIGVTLLEVMLVLSIIALIILMSVRYYQATTNASQTEQALQLIQALTASADNLAMGNIGGYSIVNSANVAALAGSGILSSPWGSTVTFSGTGSTTYTVTIPGVPPSVCTNVTNKISANSKYTALTCDDNGLSYTYNSSQ